MEHPEWGSWGATPVTFQVAGKKARTALLPANSLNTFVL